MGTAPASGHRARGARMLPALPCLGDQAGWPHRWYP